MPGSCLAALPALAAFDREEEAKKVYSCIAVVCKKQQIVLPFF
jgi:hypothetical protein